MKINVNLFWNFQILSLLKYQTYFLISSILKSRKPLSSNQVSNIYVCKQQCCVQIKITDKCFCFCLSGRESFSTCFISLFITYPNIEIQIGFNLLYPLNLTNYTVNFMYLTCLVGLLFPVPNKCKIFFPLMHTNQFC